MQNNGCRTLCARMWGLLMLACFTMCVAVVAACSSDKDDFEYSQMMAEMCDVYTSKAKQIGYAVVDDDRRLGFQEPISCSWATKADTVYRALLYYNKVEGSATVQALAASYALYLTPKNPHTDPDSLEAMDPLEVGAVWYAKNGRHLNMLLTLKSGNTTDDGQKHRVGLVCDSVASSSTGSRYFYRLCHAQNDVPTYYSVSVYASIPTADIGSGDTLTLTVPSWNGIVEKDYIKP